MFRPKVSAKTVVGNTVAAVAASLFPGAMLGFPPMRAMLLPTAPFEVRLASGLRMRIAPLRAGMLGWLPVAVGLTALLRGLPVLMAAPQFLRHLRGPVGRPLLLSAIVPLLLANRPGPRLPPLVVGRALLPLFLLVSFLLPKRVILFLPFLLFPFLLFPFLSLASLVFGLLGRAGRIQQFRLREARRIPPLC